MQMLLPAINHTSQFTWIDKKINLLARS